MSYVDALAPVFLCGDRACKKEIGLSEVRGWGLNWIKLVFFKEEKEKVASSLAPHEHGEEIPREDAVRRQLSESQEERPQSTMMVL